MDIQTDESVHTKQAEKKLPKNIRLNFKLDAKHDYLLKQACEKLGSVDRTYAFEWMLERFEELKQAEILVHAYTKMRASEKEFDDLIQQKVV